MTRRATALGAIALLAALLAFDAATADLNPYRAPALLALGSGAVPTGAHCASLPE